MFYSPFLALLCLSQGLPGLQSSGTSTRLAHNSYFCSSIQMKEGKWDSQVNEDLQRSWWRVAEVSFSATVKAKNHWFVISVTALTTVAQILKGIAATLHTEKEIWEGGSGIETLRLVKNFSVRRWAGSSGSNTRKGVKEKAHYQNSVPFFMETKLK